MFRLLYYRCLFSVRKWFSLQNLLFTSNIWPCWIPSWKPQRAQKYVYSGLGEITTYPNTEIYHYFWSSLTPISNIPARSLGPCFCLTWQLNHCQGPKEPPSKLLEMSPVVLSSVIWPTSTRLYVISAFSAQQDHSSLLEFNLPKPCLENVSRQTARVKRVLNSFISFILWPFILWPYVFQWFYFSYFPSWIEIHSIYMRVCLQMNLAKVVKFLQW